MLLICIDTLFVGTFCIDTICIDTIFVDTICIDTICVDTIYVDTSPCPIKIFLNTEDDINSSLSSSEFLVSLRGQDIHIISGIMGVKFRAYNSEDFVCLSE